MCAVLTVIIVSSFYALFLVANEMEDPFGSEANDMPMLEYHQEFCACVMGFLTDAWLPEEPRVFKRKARNAQVGARAGCLQRARRGRLPPAGWAGRVGQARPAAAAALGAPPVDWSSLPRRRRKRTRRCGPST